MAAILARNSREVHHGLDSKPKAPSQAYIKSRQTLKLRRVTNMGQCLRTEKDNGTQLFTTCKHEKSCIVTHNELIAERIIRRRLLPRCVRITMINNNVTTRFLTSS